MKKLLLIYFSFLCVLLIHRQATAETIDSKYFKVIIDDATKNISFCDVSGNVLANQFTFYTRYKNKGGDKKDSISLWIRNFTGSVSKEEKDVTKISLLATTDFCTAQLFFIFDKTSSEIKFESQVTYKKETEVVREAIIMDMKEPLTEVYRKNRTCDRKDFQREYWLDKEGAKFGKGKKTFLIYHVPDVSSLQLNVRENQLIVNLDYSDDHPFDHFPSLDSASDVKQNLSCSLYNKDQSRKNSFSFNIGREINYVPQLMQSPNGFLSSIAFTEHADWTDIRIHRAVHFGSEDIKSASNATGGFVKNKIPITKSVFYSNPDNVLNTDAKNQTYFKTPIASIKGTDGYLDFLKELSSVGNEICLHTPDQFTAKSSLVEEACAFMKTNFSSVTWIDHGYENGPKNNREAFVCDGLVASSPSYSKDIWEKHGVKYFWNSYYEDFKRADSSFTDFNGSLIHPYPGFGDASPTPLYWKHPTRTENFYSWPTMEVFGVKEASSWGYLFNDGRLNDFADLQAAKFIHCYPSECLRDKIYWSLNAEKKIIIEPEFEKTLERLASYRDKGLINLTTVRDLLNYWTACENIKYTFIDDGNIKIENENEFDVNGISFSSPSRKVSVNNQTPNLKMKKDQTIFWFDLKAKSSAVIKLG